MGEQHPDATRTVLLVTEHEMFRAPVAEQLAAHGHSVRTLSPEETLGELGSEGCCPAAAFVDCEAETSDGIPLCQAIRDALPGCRILLICTMDQTSTGAGLARAGDVWDYVSTDSVRDPNRIPLVVDRALGKTPADDNAAERQHGQILETLSDLREMLKDGSRNPVAKLLDGFKSETTENGPSDDLLGEVAVACGDSLVELIFGRLRRIEDQLLLMRGETTSAAVRSTGGRILVVEDDTISGELAEHILQRKGFEVAVAPTVEAARALLDKQPPNLMLVDVHLGDADGLQFIREVRAGSACPDVPVIVITCDRMRRTLFKAVGMNVQGYLLKPYHPNMLVGKVKAVLAESGSEACPTASS